MAWVQSNEKCVGFIICVGLLVSSMTITTAPVAVAGEPQHGGSLRIAFGMPLFETNFILNSWTGASIPFTNMYNRLLNRAPDWTIIPELARTWEVDEKGTKYTFHLEEEVRFHDGTPMTSADVKHTFYAAYGAQSTTGNRLRSVGLKSITTPDDYTIEFEFESSCALSFFIGTNGDVFIKPKHLYEAPDIDWDTLHIWDKNERDSYESHSHSQDKFNATAGSIEGKPIGTGPFRFVKYNESHFHFERFEDYWEAGLPYLDDLYYVYYPIYPDREKASINSLIALTLGEVDAYHSWYPAFPLEHMDTLNNSKDFTVNTMGNYGTWRITFNMNPESSPKDPLSANPDEQWVLNNNVRIAMEYAINKEALVQNIFYNVMPAQYTAIPDYQWAYNDALEHRKYNKEKAEQILDAEGYTIQADGWRLHNVNFKIGIIPINAPYLEAMGEWIEADLRAIGIEATSVPLDWVPFGQLYETGEEVGEAQWNMMDENQEAFAIANMATHYPGWLVYWLYTWDETNRGFYNFGHYSNARVDALLDQALETPNLADQAPLLDEIQEIVWNESPFIFLIPLYRVEAWNNRYDGFNPSNRPLAMYGSYKLVYDTTIDVSTDYDRSTLIIAIVALGSIGAVGTYAYLRSKLRTRQRR